MTDFIIDIVWAWLAVHGPGIGFILLGIYIVRKFSGVFIEKSVRRFVVRDERTTARAEQKRENTLIAIISGTARVMLWIIGAMLVLDQMGIPIAPVLAAAGVAGIAVGFGGQYLIRDIITGLFVILENQYRVDDIVEIGGKVGTVEDITLRMTTLRDLDGTVHHVPHGEVTTVSNFTKFYSNINMNIGVGYSSDIQKVTEVVNRVGAELAENNQWKDRILEAPQFLRVDEFADSAVIIKILGKTEPQEQWAVAGELRKRLKDAFDEAGIEIPFPQRVIHQAA